jgi:hypothetical protein
MQNAEKRRVLTTTCLNCAPMNEPSPYSCQPRLYPPGVGSPEGLPLVSLPGHVPCGGDGSDRIRLRLFALLHESA